MRMYSLTSVGDAQASASVPNPSPAQRVLYWMKRNGGHGSDEQMAGQLGMDGTQLQMILNKMKNFKPPLITQA
jgi:hypothetical protein